MDHYINTERMNGIRFYQARIHHYKKLIQITSCPICKLKLEAKIIKQIDCVLDLIDDLSWDMESYPMERLESKPNEFTLEELSAFDGSHGRRAYVVVNGIVYDVSLEPTWGGASHFGLKAGMDLSNQFKGCHGISSILSKLQQVGILKGSEK